MEPADNTGMTATMDAATLEALTYYKKVGYRHKNKTLAFNLLVSFFLAGQYCWSH